MTFLDLSNFCAFQKTRVRSLRFHLVIYVNEISENEFLQGVTVHILIEGNNEKWQKMMFIRSIFGCDQFLWFPNYENLKFKDSFFNLHEINN